MDSSEKQWTKLDCDELNVDPHNRQYKKIVFEQVRASEHLALCSSSNSQFNTNCFTGVRVYDGSKILAAFVLSNRSIQNYLSSCSISQKIVELGCGCGLSGVAASEVILTEQEKNNDQENSNRTIKITFTDMQPSCLEIAEKNIERVRQNHSEHSFILKTKFQLLRWSKEGVEEFIEKDNDDDDEEISLILGAELIYFRVDLRALLSTIKSLLEFGKAKNKNGICLLCHVNRLVGGRQELPKLLRHEDLSMSFKNLSMKQALASLEEAKYFDHSMTLSFLDRVDFLAIALNDESLIRVFGDFNDESNLNYDHAKNQESGGKNNMNNSKKQNEEDEEEFLGKLGGSDLF
jgi:hypothetical protein